MRSARTFVAFLSVTLSAIGLAGCGPTNGLPPVSGEFLYVANGGNGRISEFSIDTATGALTNVATFKTNTAFGLSSLSIHPTNEFIYTTDINGLRLFGYDIGDTTYDGQDYNGRIFGGNTEIPSDGSLTAITPDGKYLYATSFKQHLIEEYSINLVPGTPEDPNQENGLLTLIGTVSNTGEVYGMTFDASGRYAFVVQPPRGVLQYIVEADGRLTPNGSFTLSGPDTSMRSIAITKFGGSTGCAYVTSRAGLYQFAIQNDGALSFVGTASQPHFEPDDVKAHPLIPYVYAGGLPTNTSASFISSLNVSTSCALSFNQTLPLPNGHAARIAIDASGKFAYTANLFTSTVDEFAINSTTGQLGFIAEVDSGSAENPFSLPTGIVTTH
jgi:6-phosphogluconolactonase (cycloisomerase 2 family)